MGIITGMIPGLHVNTLAAVALALLPEAGLVGATFLVAVGTVHTIVNIIPGTYMGLPDEGEGLSMLPAHRMLLKGQGSAAIRASVAASLGALVLVAFALVAYRRLVDAPVLAQPLVVAAILVLASLFLWTQERRKGWKAPILAAGVFLSAAALGTLAFLVPIKGWTPVAGNPLLPLLGGLFGAAGLSFAFAKPRPVPVQATARPARRFAIPVLGATAAAAVTALLPGLTSAVAASFIPGTRQQPVRIVAALSAVNTAHATFSLAVWMMAGRIRSGLADASTQWVGIQWSAGVPPLSAATLLATVLVAGVLGAAGTLLLDRWLGPRVHRIPSRFLAGVGLATIAALTLAFTGWFGLLLAFLATLLGRIPLHLGIRRVHLVGALIGPALMRIL